MEVRRFLPLALLAIAAIVLFLLITHFRVRSVPESPAEISATHRDLASPSTGTASPEVDAKALVVEPPVSSANRTISDDTNLEAIFSCWKADEFLRRKEFMFALDRYERTSGDTSASISAVVESSNLGGIFQIVDATPLKGRRVELTADMRAKGARRGATFWFRAEDAQGNLVAIARKLVSYDPKLGRISLMEDPDVKPDLEWTTEHLVLDIPDDARVVSFGFGLGGAGQVWVDNVRIEVVTADVPTTAPAMVPLPGGYRAKPSDLTNKPRNLDFEMDAGAPCN